MLPLGEHKGSGLAFVVGLLAGVLPGAAFGRAIAGPEAEWTLPGDAGHWLLAVAPARFGAAASVAARVDAAIDLLHVCASAPGFAAVLVPGELEARTAARQEREGIAYSRCVVEALNRPAALGLPALWPPAPGAGWDRNAEGR